MDEIISRPRRQLEAGSSRAHGLHKLTDAGSPGGHGHQVALPLIEDSTEGGRSIDGEETDAKYWIVVQSDGTEFGSMFDMFAITTLGGCTLRSCGMLESLARQRRSWTSATPELRKSVLAMVACSEAVLCTDFDRTGTDMKAPKHRQRVTMRGCPFEWYNAYAEKPLACFIIYGERSHDEPTDIGPALDAVPREDGRTAGACFSGHAGWDLAWGTADGAVRGRPARFVPWQPGTEGRRISNSSVRRYVALYTASNGAKAVIDGTLTAIAGVGDLVIHVR